MSETTTFAPDGRSPVQERSPSALSAKLKTAFNRFRGVPVETDLAAYARTVRSIRMAHHSGKLAAIADAEIARRAAALRQPPADGASIPPSGDEKRARVALVALALEAARRATGLDAHDVQLMAGLAMTDGRIAELPTGEGKTLAAVFSASYFALLGRPVHVLTFNDYLARRDAVWMGPAYRLLGLSVGAVHEALDKAAKKAAYACDITYATAKEAGFDYLRDRLAYEPGELVHRPFSVALVDEADSILIDEARIPLVISGTSGTPGLDVSRLAAVVRDLERGRDFETDAENANVFPTDAGIRRVESALGCGNLFTPENETLLAAVHCALHAELLLERDVDYIVRDGRIEIVDEFTGRVMDKRHWPDGLQAAVEAKEGVRRGSEGRILGSITLQHFFRLYPTLCGMTATAEPSARELKEFYGLGVVVVPSHRPCVRRDLPDVVFTHREARRTALVREIAACRAAGRPVLVGTSSVRESEELAAALAGAGVPCEVLNAKNDELEAAVIARAGVPGAVTISTNMAGRGTDIKLGGPNNPVVADEEEHDRVAALGGLYVIGMNRHESLRIDSQLRGRAGRQGDPGSSRFFISLEDDIFERYGLTRRLFSRYRLERGAAPVDNELLRKEIAHGQRITEGRNLDIRRALWDYATLVETQRRIVAGWRDAVFAPDGAEAGLPFPTAPELVEAGTAKLGRDPFERLARRAALYHIDGSWTDHLAWLADLREGIHLVSIGRKEPLQEFQKAATDAFLELEDRIGAAIDRTLRSLVAREGPIDLEAAGLKGPSSTWTYLVNEDQFGWGVELLKGTNIGVAAGAAAFYGPLFLLALIANRFKKKKG
ncbi:MAG: accessory Sec system translocase SecA2 [Candidatus Aminicenantes bacterium]|nr:accessory Sec system translocase SecA2 [Candidatus Aminicenantes bacterium]